MGAGSPKKDQVHGSIVARVESMMNFKVQSLSIKLQKFAFTQNSQRNIHSIVLSLIDGPPARWSLGSATYNQDNFLQFPVLCSSFESEASLE